MSGICGMLALGDERPDEAVLGRMADAIRHRGPDSQGVAVSESCGLAQVCLAAEDPCEAAPQPLRLKYQPPYRPESPPGELWIAKSGRVFNYEEVKAALRALGHNFQTDSDAETLLRSYIQFGRENFIKAFRGAFAMAIWDVTEQRLLLVRDRLGQQPLYYTQIGDWLVFGSEIKAILAHPAVPKRLHTGILPHYLAHGYPPPPDTFYEGIYALPPGHSLCVDLSEDEPRFEIDAYWHPPYPTSGGDPRSEQNIATDLLAHLRGAIRVRLGDTTPGALLSGGLDSAAVVALLAQESSQTIQTFLVSLSETPAFDERRHARQISARYVTEHHEIVEEPDILALASEIVWVADQPFGDESVLPLALVSRRARDFTPVVFTGDGGDELFAGYDYYRMAWLAGQVENLPSMAHRALGGVLDILPEQVNLVHQASDVMRASEMPLAERYLNWVRCVPGEWLTALMGGQRERAVLERYRALFDETVEQEGDVVARLLDVNLRSALPGGLLTRVDRASMGASLAVRTPFLDHQLVHFVATIPTRLKVRRGIPKYILKQAMQDVLPESVLESKHHSVDVPVGEWFRGKLSGTLRDVLLSERAAGHDLFDMEAVRAMLDEHQSGRTDLGHALWTLFTFELWYQQAFEE